MYLDLAGNNLSGRIPAELANLSGTLQYLYLDANNFEGPIPRDFGRLTELRRFTPTTPD